MTAFPGLADDWPAAARRLPGGVLAVEGATPLQGGFGASGDRTTSVSVRHVDGDAEIDVEVSVDHPWPHEHVERLLLGDLWHAATDSAGLGFPLEVRVDREEREVPVDGHPVRLVLLWSGRSWSAHGRAGGRELLLRGRGWPREALRLRTVDPADVPRGA